MLDELSGDHAQTLHLAMIAQLMQTEDDSTKATINTKLDQCLIETMVTSDTIIGAQVTKNLLTYTGYGASLLELHIIVQTAMMNTVSSTYGYFLLPNTPIISNMAVLELVNKYMELMSVHHALILTTLNVDQKVKDKHNLYLLS